MRRPPDCAVNTAELNAIIDGIGRSEDGERVDAAFAAMRLYYSALRLERLPKLLAFLRCPPT